MNDRYYNILSQLAAYSFKSCYVCLINPYTCFANKHCKHPQGSHCTYSLKLSCYVCLINPPYIALLTNTVSTQAMHNFHVFMSLHIAICLAAMCATASHQEHLCHHFGLSGTVFSITQVVSYSNETPGRMANSMDTM